MKRLIPFVAVLMLLAGCAQAGVTGTGAPAASPLAPEETEDSSTFSPAPEQTPETEGIVFWLYRQDTDEYLLYLPDQDRSLLEGGLTASEETEEDSEVCLVLRARTPENSKPVAPEETLYCFATTSDSWNGIRVRVILDGREQEVRKLTSIGDRLYSTEETYIGRDRLEGSGT